MTDVVLRTDGLSRHFGGLVALDAVSLEVDRGEIYGVIGPNGAGKSTLFNAIAGVVTPSSGTVTFEGRRIDRLPPHRRSWLGLGRTFQASQSFPTHTVMESLLSARSSLHRGVRGWLRSSAPRDDMEIARVIAGFVDLGTALDKRPAQLTNLEQRRLAIGMALATECSVLLLDEPSGGLIESEVSELVEFIRKVRDSGVTAVVIDHKMRLMMQLCDRIMVMASGRVIAVGAPEEIAAHEEVIDVYLGRPTPATTKGS
ncbi:ABC transporter ATP-binding protein [Streptomyces sp. NPDC005708]|uniref:ABC transporter ATP-binding protein n=1 Tax=Streptomyces sp. NPDC005708 TaxID=3154564 RepID=UPI0033E2362F